MKHLVYAVLRYIDELVFGKRQKAYRHMMDYSMQRPLDINIETTTICPMKCKFCCNRLYDRGRNIMPMEMFASAVEKYVNEFNGGTIGLGSMQSDFFSDPLLLERFEVIKLYKDKLWVHSTTPLISAARLSDGELLEVISNMDFLEVSVEGFDKKTYEAMCGVNGFDMLIAQLKRIRKLIDDNSLKIDIAIAFRTYDRKGLIESKTYKDLVQMFRDGGIIDKFFSWFGSIKDEDLPKGAKLRVSNNIGKAEDCVVPHATLAIQTNGNVVGCGCIDWLEKYVIGNINEDSLIDIWTSKKAIRFRKAFSCGGKLPDICKECGLYKGVSCFSRKVLLNYESKDGLYYWVR